MVSALLLWNIFWFLRDEPVKKWFNHLVLNWFWLAVTRQKHDKTVHQRQHNIYSNMSFSSWHNPWWSSLVSNLLTLAISRLGVIPNETTGLRKVHALYIQVDSVDVMRVIGEFNISFVCTAFLGSCPWMGYISQASWAKQTKLFNYLKLLLLLLLLLKYFKIIEIVLNRILYHLILSVIMLVIEHICRKFLLLYG